MNNVCTEQVRINEIWNTHIHIWCEGEDELLWDSFENKVFADIYHRDHVAHFHYILNE